MNKRSFDKRYSHLSAGKRREVYKRLRAAQSKDEKALRAFIKGLKFTASAAGTVLSVGAGGDTIPDLLFLAMDAGVLAVNILDFVRKGSKEAKVYLDVIASQRWDGDPEMIKIQTEEVIRDIRENGGEKVNTIIDEICNQYAGIIDGIAATIGNIFAAMIPDDAGVGRLVIEEFISRMMKKNKDQAYDNAVKYYDMIPQIGQDALEDKDKLLMIFYNIIDFIREAIPKDEEGYEEFKKKYANNTMGKIIPNHYIRTASAVTQTASQFSDYNERMEKQIEIKLVANIPEFVDVIQQSLALLFSAAVFITTCEF